ncbi:hypothetical protein HK097_008976 [Rhizophlyctis rosea]|uniref:Uncharacterized protein n=1 Tax=Rhizophlyctis rosea TaxID=64517 RepID=A0AAD5S9Q7_9FUNG|nr:hypothetical protein HK097_008976 [Rhizophlyctis rosea]
MPRKYQYETIEGKKLRVGSRNHRAALRRMEQSQAAYDVPTEAEQKKRDRNARQRANYARKRAPQSIEDLDERAEQIVSEYFDNPEPAPPVQATEEVQDDRWNPIREKVAELNLDPRKVYHYELSLQADVAVVLKDGSFIATNKTQRIETEYDFGRNVRGSDVLNHILDFCIHWAGDGYTMWDLEDVQIQVTEATNSSVTTQKALLREQLRQRRRDVGAPILAVDGVNQNQTEDGTCGIALAKSCGITQKTLTGMWAMAEEGVSIMDIQAIADREGRTHVVVGVDGKVLYKKTARNWTAKDKAGDGGYECNGCGFRRQVDEVNRFSLEFDLVCWNYWASDWKDLTTSGNRRHRKSLCYYAVGKHFYPIVDDSMRQRLGNHASDTVDICSDCGEETPFNIDKDFCDACRGELDTSRQFIASRKKVISTHNPMRMLDLFQMPCQALDSVSVDEALAMAERSSVSPHAPVAVVLKEQPLEDLICALHREKIVLVPSDGVRVAKLSIVTAGGETQRRVGVSKFRIGKHLTFHYNPHFEHVKNACKVLNIPYNGQTPMLLLMDLFLYTFPEATSTTNTWTEDWFPNTHLALNQVFQKLDRYSAEDVTAYDCVRSYENNCRSKMLPWAIFHSADYPTPYDPVGNPIEQLRPGIYYVQFEGSIQPLWFQKLAIQFPDGYYYQEILRFIHRASVRFEIVEQMLAQTTLPADAMQKIFSRVYAAFPDEIAKSTCREFIGFLNKRMHRIYKAAYSPEISDLNHSFLCRGPVQAVGSSGLHRGMTYDDYEKPETYVPLYQQAIEQGWINTIQLALCIAPERWVMMKTDEIVVEKGAVFDERAAEELVVKYRVEEITPQKENQLLKFTQFQHTYARPSWKSISSQPDVFTWKFVPPEMWEFKDDSPGWDVPSLLINGPGGTGKTRGTKRFIATLASGAVLVTASTHKAALIVGGKTVHSALYFDSRTAAFLVNMRKEELIHVRYIVIDEAGMLPWYVIRSLVTFKRNNPRLRFIIIMDPTQLPPVEHRIRHMKYDMTENPLMMELCDHNRIHLTVNHRNKDLVRLYDLLANGEDVTLHVGKEVDTDFHIVFDNWRRRLLGQKVAEKLSRKGNRKRHILRGRDRDGVGKELLLFEGVRLYTTMTVQGAAEKGETDAKNEKRGGVSPTTSNVHKYVNQEDFRVMSIDDKYVKLHSLTRKAPKHIIKVEKDRVFRDFEYAYARTMYGVQGVTLEEPYTIHRWEHLQPSDRNVPIGRARETSYINICPGCDVCTAANKDVVDEEALNKEFASGTLKEKQELSLVIINRILRGHCTDEFTQLHTCMCREQLAEHLNIQDGITKGWVIEHSKARATFTEEDIGSVNHYQNLQIVPKIVNELKGTVEIRFYEW